MKNNIDVAYFDGALAARDSQVGFGTKLKMFFSGYEMDEINNAGMNKIEPPKAETAPVRTAVAETVKPEPTYSGQPDFSHFPNREEACIPKDTIIEGSISTKSNLLICGFVRGDVVSENNITVTGKIEGNIQAKSVYVNKGAVDGNINCTDDVCVGELSTVKGNIESQALECDGEVRGDISTTKSVTLKSKAFVDGNISTRSINMQDGSLLRGSIEMPTDRFVD